MKPTFYANNATIKNRVNHGGEEETIPGLRIESVKTKTPKHQTATIEVELTSSGNVSAMTDVEIEALVINLINNQ